MNKNAPGTYSDHLNLATELPQSADWNYGMYLGKSQMHYAQHKLSSMLIFLLDFTSKTYPILGNNTNQIIGHPKDAFLEGGLDFTLHHYKDFEILNKEIFPEEVRIMRNVATDDLSQFRFSKSYRFKSEKGEYRTMLQRNNMICVKDQTVPVAIFGFISDITPFSEKGKVTHQIEKYDANEDKWNTLSSKEYYPDIDQNKLLSKREIEILKWSVEGLGSKQISEKLYISFNTVNTHRRNMLRKTNCQNSMELLKYAIENKLL